MFVLFFGSGPYPWGSQVLSTPEERKSENSDRWPTTPNPFGSGVVDRSSWELPVEEKADSEGFAQNFPKNQDKNFKSTEG